MTSLAPQPSTDYGRATRGRVTLGLLPMSPAADGVRAALQPEATKTVERSGTAMSARPGSRCLGVR